MPKTVKQTLYGATLDITEYRLSLPKLKEKIIEDIKSTQMFDSRHLPDKILMTEDQFKLLDDDVEAYGSEKHRFYRTPYNLMQVKVVR
jgi:hypothetical protein